MGKLLSEFKLHTSGIMEMAAPILALFPIQEQLEKMIFILLEKKPVPVYVRGHEVGYYRLIARLRRGVSRGGFFVRQCGVVCAAQHSKYVG